MATNTNTGNFRNPTITEPRIFGSPQTMHTPVGTIRTMSGPPPAVPPRPFSQQASPFNSYGSGVGGMYGGGGMSSMFGSGYGNSLYGSGLGGGGYNSYGAGYNSYGGGYGGFGSGYGSGYGGGMGMGYNRYGANGSVNPMDPESRFIQIAEDSSRPAFQSIESLVSAIGNIAAMLDSTFFAITSSFRAILGVAANFGRLRGVFAQFWSTFAILRGLSWLYKKILYWLKLSKIDPSKIGFGEAFAAASAQGFPAALPDAVAKGNSSWPILVFLGFIFSAPYLIMKMIGTVSQTALEETRNPLSWVNPIKASALHDFVAANAQELNIRAGQSLLIAPREVQNTQKLIGTGWILASLDHQTSGLIPINYIAGPKQMASNSLSEQSAYGNEQNQPISELLPQTFDDNFPVDMESV